MSFIVLTNTKGGVGKSTLAAHLAIWLHDHGKRVALLDTDVQKTASRWVIAAEPAITVIAASEMEEIQRARSELMQSHDYVVADTPGRESDAARTATLLADLAIVPLQPSKPDLRALHDALKSIRLGHELSGGSRPRALLVLNLTAKNDVQSRLLRCQLAELGLHVARSEVRRLNAIRDSCDGTVTRLRPSGVADAAGDIHALFAEIFSDARPAVAPSASQDRPRRLAAHE